MIDTTIIGRAPAAATTLHDHPKIAISKQLTQDFPSKVDVVNQRLNNFAMAQSMIKPEGTRYNRNDFGGANTTQQLGISASLQFNSVVTKEADRHEKDPSKMYQSKKNSSLTELTTNNDTNMSTYYRYYANPRHCYRLPLETKHSFLGTFMLDRNVAIPMRTVMDFAPRNTKPPIREPDMPEKRDEKKDRKDKKKPIIRTDRESVDSNESQEGMETKDNPKSDPDTAVRYEWGVKLNEESTEATRDNDNFNEKNRRYVTKQLWGVNLKQSEEDVEDVAFSTSASSKRRTEEYRNISNSSKRANNVSQLSKESDESNLRYTTAGYLSTSSNRTNTSSVQEDTYNADSFFSSKELWRMMKISPEKLAETTVIDGDYNIPQGAAVDAEITAWKHLMLKSKKHMILEKEESLLGSDMENFEMMSIRPEAPQPKLDVQVVKSAREYETKSMRTLDVKGGSVKMENIENKKLHTATMQIRYIHGDVNNVSQLNTAVPVSSAFVDKATQKQPGTSRSVVSANPKNPTWERVIDEISNQQDNEQPNSKCHHEEKSNGLDAGVCDSLRDTKSSLLLVSQTSYYNHNKKQSKTQNAIANKKMKISLDQLQYDNYKESAIHQWNTTQYFQKSNINDKYINFQNKCTTAGLNLSSTSNISIKSHVNVEINVTKENTKSSIKKQKNINSDSNLKENLDNNLSKEYSIDSNYVRLRSNPYLFSRENLDKWRVPRSKNPIYKPIKHNMSLCEIVAAPSIPRKTNNTYVNAAGKLDDSHAATVIETSGSNNDVNAKNTRQTKRFHVSSQDQRVVVDDCLLDDATNALKQQRWREIFSIFDGTNVNKKMDNSK